MWQKYSSLILFLVLVTALVGCQSTQPVEIATSVAVTVTATPTSFPTPTLIPRATPTPVPTVAMAKPRPPNNFQKGVNVLLYGNYGALEEFRRKSQKLLDRLAGLGVNSVSLVVPVFMDGWTSVDVYADEELTPSKKRIAVFFEEAKRRGFTTMLRPLLDEQNLNRDGHWRGNIAPRNKEEWFQNYTSLILEYARLAQTESVDVFCIGVEFTSLEQETHSWVRLIAAVREAYQGGVTYSMNWRYSYQDYADLTFWKALDFVSVDAFYPLGEYGPEEVTVEQLVGLWRNWKLTIAQVRKDFGSLVFTELGVASQPGSHRRPWIWDRERPGVDLEAQRRYYEAACQALAHAVDGIYWWEVDLDLPKNPENDSGFNPLGKPAEREIATCYKEVIPTNKN